MQEQIQSYLDDLTSLLGRLPMSAIQQAIGLLTEARYNDRQVIIMGNGGSAATASHFACDLGKGTLMPGHPRFHVLALTDNMPLFSALANDFGYDQVFSEQIKSLVRPGDVVIGISGSGRSLNVLNAIRAARESLAVTIGFVGYDGGLLKDEVDVAVHVPSWCMEQVEDVHLILEHLISTCLRQACQAAEQSHPAETGADVLADLRIPLAPGRGGNGRQRAHEPRFLRGRAPDDFKA